MSSDAQDNLRITRRILMCGIVGYIGKRNAVPILIEGIKRLDYRGYDSAGIGCITGGKIKILKKEGRISSLESVIPQKLNSVTGIAHTRWATHGGVSDENAHPHTGDNEKVAIVHNGIIDNYSALKKILLSEGHIFKSETDSEVAAHLAEKYLSETNDPDYAVKKTIGMLEGTYGILFLFIDFPDILIGVRNGSPLVVGIGDGEMFLASDVNAIIGHTKHVIYLGDRETVLLTRKEYRTTNFQNIAVTRPVENIEWEYESADKSGYEDYMLKEIFEQPESISRAFGSGGRLIPDFGTAKLGGLNLEKRDFFDIKRAEVIAMGTAHHAGMIGAMLLESLARMSAKAEIACELRYRNPVVEKDILYFAVSQSGETLDTIASMREIQNKGGRVLGICNMVGSTIARESDGGVYIHAGPEMAVASTKAFTGQVTAFLLIAILIGRMRGLSLAEGKMLVREVQNIPEKIKHILLKCDEIKKIALKYKDANNFFFLGRGINYPVALEGALKLKEISYIHAEGFSAGDMKHGPIALVTESTPVFFIATKGETYDKIIGNMQEIKARKGRVIAVTNYDDGRISNIADNIITIPESREELSPLLTVIPLQLFAYYTAQLLGRNIDRPRNLAKSVTVE